MKSYVGKVLKLWTVRGGRQEKRVVSFFEAPLRDKDPRVE